MSSQEVRKTEDVKLLSKKFSKLRVFSLFGVSQFSLNKRAFNWIRSDRKEDWNTQRRQRNQIKRSHEVTLVKSFVFHFVRCSAISFVSSCFSVSTKLSSHRNKTMVLLTLYPSFYKHRVLASPSLMPENQHMRRKSLDVNLFMKGRAIF